jgi:DNA-binding XRE family transcriptional regulator
MKSASKQRRPGRRHGSQRPESESSVVPGLVQRLRERFPDGLFEVDAPVRADGVWFLDATVAGHTVAVQWQRGGRGFGITATTEVGYGDGAHEVVPDRDAAFERIVELLTSRRRTRRPAPVALGEVRRRRGVSQASLAKKLRIAQSSVSKLEQRADPLLSSLRALVEGLGGRLQLRVTFPDGQSHLLDLPPSRRRR